mmetsp:Transcript_41244/g.100082  ORF Transcript_41244/g.100082 Transcript_41244/m.100082 type:complete len:90 (-) Transcript_41244:516-785(-)
MITNKYNDDENCSHSTPENQKSQSHVPRSVQTPLELHAKPEVLPGQLMHSPQSKLLKGLQYSVLELVQSSRLSQEVAQSSAIAASTLVA